ncbi:MAG: 1-deoxy-D-xylulose-5-phosphate synthase [Actinomycetia bacterium]|nr:1-deoxy-D-xylulose-5-phosphate synthase [Actinomycetes bacterium]MCP3910009.1 1-deoxy-D-xylulose-5-phosphate synthase [Actinomycetes bacterium]
MSVAQLLNRITCPADLRRLDEPELSQLCAEIREFIVETVSRTGGHLGSNLGVVELTVALHRVFDSPRDIFLWDTGHQAYVHKLLTGRQSDFEGLRSAGGMSGYPSRDESDHDWIENSHASTALSYAHGLAIAQAAPGGDGRRILAIIGDGSLTGGMAFEGLNNLGHSDADVTIILNDNGRSYAPTVSRLSESLVKIRSNPVYMRRQARLEGLAENVPWVGDLFERGISASKAAVRQMWEPPAFFENLGVRYLGPFDGHDIGEVELALESAREFEGPVVVHVLTQKGRGHAPAENDQIKNMHDMGEVKPGTYTAAFSDSLVQLADEHPELVAITAAMPDSTGLLPLMEKHPDRVIDVGIAEQHAVTAAAGMAMGGLRPVIALYSTFLTRAFDQVNLDVGLHGQSVMFCLDRAGITGDDGASHHGVLDMALLTKVPGMTMFAPSSYQEMRQMMRDAWEVTDGPVAIRWAKTAARHVGPDEVGSGLAARKIREGTRDACLIGVGKMVDYAEGAADLLSDAGYEVTIWDPRVVVPLDQDMLDDAARHHLVVTIEDGVREGGVGAAIAARIADLGQAGRVPPVRVMGTPLSYIPHGKPDAILSELGLDAVGIAAEVTGWLGADTPAH